MKEKFNEKIETRPKLSDSFKTWDHPFCNNVVIYWEAVSITVQVNHAFKTIPFHPLSFFYFPKLIFHGLNPFGFSRFPIFRSWWDIIVKNSETAGIFRLHVISIDAWHFFWGVSTSFLSRLNLNIPSFHRFWNWLFEAFR